MLLTVNDFSILSSVRFIVDCLNMLSFQFWSIPARIAAVGSILLVLFLLMMHNDATPYQYVKSYVVEPQSMNATLNFQEIFYITMPHRTDRQDAMSLLASSTGLKLKMFPGVCSDRIFTLLCDMNM